MKIKIELFGAARDFADVNILELTIENQTNIKGIRENLLNWLKKKHPNNVNYSNIVNNSAFCNENNEIIHDDYLVSKEQKLCIIPPIGGG